MPIDLICLDADDTLWHNMRHFEAAERALLGLLKPFAATEVTSERLQAVCTRNLAVYGYGAKSFTLCMLETATELCGDKLPASAVRDIVAAGRELLTHPVELLPGVEETLDALADRARLVLVTKGELLHQEAKLAASGLGDRFSGVEIVSEKNADTMRRLSRAMTSLRNTARWPVIRSAPTCCPRSRRAPGRLLCHTMSSGSMSAPMRRSIIRGSRG
jgi:putative hydrolase of the HAD superfamily